MTLKLNPVQAEALTKATKARFLPSVPDTICLLDLIDGALAAQKGSHSCAFALRPRKRILRFRLLFVYAEISWNGGTESEAQGISLPVLK
jgi:hypothetical protein